MDLACQFLNGAYFRCGRPCVAARGSGRLTPGTVNAGRLTYGWARQGARWVAQRNTHTLWLTCPSPQHQQCALQTIIPSPRPPSLQSPHRPHRAGMGHTMTVEKAQFQMKGETYVGKVSRGGVERRCRLL